MTDWPAHTRAGRPWQQTHRGGTKEDRTLREITVWLPPRIASLPVSVSGEVVAAMESSTSAIASLDRAHGTELAALGALLLRTESVASSKIEHIDASIDDYARATQGVRANPSATSMVAATAALADLVGSVHGGRAITAASVLRAHRALLGDDPTEGGYAGRLRDVQNWIGGSDYSPRTALYVPPPADTVPGYIDDLIGFANRDDLPALLQASVVHAQFESIHPFTDGNGRIGRALINTVLRRRGTTSRSVVPLASALVAHRDRYFDLLGAYRDGEIEPIVRSFTAAAMIASEQSRDSAARIADLPQQWRDQLGGVRRGSATSRLLETLTTVPVFTAEDANARIGGPLSSTYDAITRFAGTGVLRPLTTRTRNQVWGVDAMLTELEDLSQRIAAAAH